MWIAERNAINSRDDEHSAMAYQCYGRHETRQRARLALIAGVQRQIDGWERMNMDPSRDREVLRILLNGDDDRVEVGDVRYQIREF